MSSAGEDIHAYTRLLKSQKKRSGVTLIDILFGLLSLIGMTMITILLSQRSNSNGAFILFTILIIFMLLLVISFADYAAGLGLFQGTGLYFGSALVLIGVVSSVYISFQADEIFSNSSSPQFMSLISLFNFLLNAGIISYFLITATPTREGRDQMIAKLREIRDEVIKLPIREFGTEPAVERGLKWVQFQQRKDGIWGEVNPLYETSEVLNMYIAMNKPLTHSWKSISDGKEEQHTVEQTYYLILEALDTASIEPTYEHLIPVTVVGEIDINFVKVDSAIYEDFKDQLHDFSEWEMVKEIENFDEGHSVTNELPIIFPMSKIFYMKEDLDVAQQCADIFANTFGILINRSATRFTLQTETDVSNLVLGLMYNSLIRLIRYKPKKYTPKANDDASLSEPGYEEFSLPDLSVEAPSEDTDDGFSLPDFSSQDDFGLPDLPSSDDVGNVSQNPFAGQDHAIKIGTSLASMRNYLRSRQSVDGSWSGRIDITAECLEAISDNESTESDAIKSAVHYLIALQEKNGSWQDDIRLTSRVLSVLSKINRNMDLGSFI